MNDKFLYEARPTLSDDFADELYARISRSSRSLPARNEHPFASPIAKAFAIACFILLVLFASSTEVRAQIGIMARNLARRFQAGPSHLVGNIIVVDVPPSRTQIAPSQSIQLTSIEIPVSNLDEIFASHIVIPTWAPDGCDLNPLARTYQGDPQPSAMLIWSCGIEEENWQISLTVNKAAMIGHFPTDSYEQRDLDIGQVLIVHGNWYKIGDDLEWKMGSTSIYWDRENHLYQLYSPSDRTSNKDLLKMASSAE